MGLSAPLPSFILLPSRFFLWLLFVGIWPPVLLFSSVPNPTRSSCFSPLFSALTSGSILLQAAGTEQVRELKKHCEGESPWLRNQHRCEVLALRLVLVSYGQDRVHQEFQRLWRRSLLREREHCFQGEQLNQILVYFQGNGKRHTLYTAVRLTEKCEDAHSQPKKRSPEFANMYGVFLLLILRKNKYFRHIFLKKYLAPVGN